MTNPLDIIGMILALGAFAVWIAYLAWVIVQQHYCEKLDAMKPYFPHLRSRQPAADSGPHETKWGHGLQDCYMTPRQMYRHLKKQGALKRLPKELQ